MKYNKVIYFSLIATLALQAEVNLDTITVEETIDTVTVKDVSGEELKSADLGEALSKIDPAITISRRSGIANDIILRGQKRDNINVIIDGGKIYGGCPNRMDPPISHVVTNNIDYVTINEGPYDVENFGTLSGVINIHTKAPQAGFSGEANLNVGSFGYKKGSLTMQGGDESIKALISVSKETSEQYEDGDGDKFQEQLIKAGTDPKYLYQDKYKDLDAYDKRSFMGKIYFNLSDNQELKLSYTANRSDDVLYPNSPMDALYDDSDLYNVEYTIKNLNKYSKKLDFLYYYSDVDHPMSTVYRNSAATNPEKTNHMWSKITGTRLKNNFLYNNFSITYGLDASEREWKGRYYIDGNPGQYSLPKAVTDNSAFFVDTKTTIDKNHIKFGLRYDDTDITNDGGFNEPSFNSLNGYVFNTYKLDSTTDIFGGLGVSHRVPDGRELYFTSYMGTTKIVVGTPTLDQTKNTEVDIGIKKTFTDSIVKAKVFYSRLNDYIYFDNSRRMNKFVNIDAKIYGLELGGSYTLNDALNFEYGLIYQRGKKDDPLPGQTDTDLADIVPIRANLITNYTYDAKTDVSFEIIAQGRWTKFDADNGEQELPGFATANIKVKKDLTDKLNITFGVDNIFDKTYAPSNTYADLTLVTTGASQKVKLNDPGRYAYLNVSYKF